MSLNCWKGNFNINMNNFDEKLIIASQGQITSVQLILFETWKPIPGFPPYEVSTFGKIRKHEKIKPLNKTNNYQYIFFNHEYNYIGIALHILIALTFIGPRHNDLIVNHIDGNSGNNRLDNLEYLTYSGNVYHGKIIHNHSTTHDQKRYMLEYKKEQKKAKRILNQTKRRIKNAKRQHSTITSIHP